MPSAECLKRVREVVEAFRRLAFAALQDACGAGGGEGGGGPFSQSGSGGGKLDGAWYKFSKLL